MKKAFCALIALVCLLSGCASAPATPAEVATLRFRDSVDLSAIEALDGKAVSIVGYMATLSPLDGSYIYLMNLPYQSCPFCVPNTTQLANTMAIYGRDGAKGAFTYTDQAIRVTGRMQMGDYTDDFGYKYNYRIVDATYEVVDLATVSSDYGLWYSIAEDGIVSDINAMFDYLYFVCQWTEYTSYAEAEDGTRTEFYLYPGDTERYLADDSAYGYAAYGDEDYFPGLIRRIRAISRTGLEDLVSIVEEAQAAKQYALSELRAGNYAYDEAEDKYTLNDAQGLYDRFNAPYEKFSQWLAKWEL